MPGRFVEVTYRTSLFDDPVRPVLRFRLQGGEEIDRFLPGPVAGAAMWVGRVPHGTIEVWISPTRHRGRFDFVVESVHRRNGVLLWLQALWRSPRYALSALFYGLPGFVAEYDMNLHWAIGFTPLEQFETWRNERARAVDLTGIDAPRTDWIKGPRILVVISGSQQSQDSLQSLRAQVYPNWHLRESADWLDQAADDDLVFVLRAGDRLDSLAFASASEHAARHPEQQVFYADEVKWHAKGTLAPVFKPGWSPLLQAARPYLGRAVFARVGFVRGLDVGPYNLARAIGAPEAFPHAAIGHLRRMLLTRSRHADDKHSATAGVAWPEAAPRPPPASIIIPTRDRGDLLQKCIASIFAHTEHPDYSIVVVDNGSVAAETQKILTQLKGDRRVTVLAQPGPFNFAALCNAGAVRSSLPTLVFLNDDTTISRPDWLMRLTAAASLPEMGAVGARLVYPDGRLQHAGVSLGIGETAGHFGAGAPQADSGWCGRHGASHEVAAVTGACLAVERRKFDAVGGFDSANLPVELNDVDLCLRLAERGWKAICLPEPSLIHAESATRGGAKFRLLKVHQRERAYFVQRWRAMIRDDPYFHPGFSLFRRREALG